MKNKRAAIEKETLLRSVLMDVEEVTPYPAPSKNWEDVAEKIFHQFEHDETIRMRKREIGITEMSADWAKRITNRDAFIDFLESFVLDKYTIRAFPVPGGLDESLGLSVNEDTIEISEPVVDSVSFTNELEMLKTGKLVFRHNSARVLPIRVEIDEKEHQICIFFVKAP